MAKMVLGIFADRNQAEDAIRELESLDYNPKDISIVMKDNEMAHDVAGDTGTNVVSGAATGATTGGVIGGIAGLLVGIGAIAIPGVGALLIGGPLAVALRLTGTAASTVSGAVTGALAGGLVGALMGLGIPEEEARSYEERIQEGGILIAVPTSIKSAEEVKDILDNNGADQIKAIDTTKAEVREREAKNYDEDEDYSYRTSDDYEDIGPSAYAGMKGGRTRRDEEYVDSPRRIRGRKRRIV